MTYQNGGTDAQLIRPSSLVQICVHVCDEHHIADIRWNRSIGFQASAMELELELGAPPDTSRPSALCSQTAPLVAHGAIR